MQSILIVEDDPVVGNIYKSKLQTEGFLVELITDGESALKRLPQISPDLIILDLGLPKMNGLEVLRRIRAEPETATLPVIVLSNSYISGLIQAAWKAGANKCLTKAVCTPRQLLEIIHTMLSPAVASIAGGAISNSASGFPLANPALAPRAGTALSDEIASERGTRQGFLKNAPNSIQDLRGRLQRMARPRPESDQSAELIGFYRSVHALAGNAGVVGLHHSAQLACALEALLKELHEKPRNVGLSPFRTIASAIDCLAALFAHAASTPSEAELSPAILVLDDDTISRRTLCLALEKANLRAVSVDEPGAALKLLEENSFDLIFSDINMPAMSGFDFCTKVRDLPRHKSTPLVFVTSLSDFKSRAESKLRGGTDLIGKPFLLIEVAVKALTLLLLGLTARGSQRTNDRPWPDHQSGGGQLACTAPISPPSSAGAGMSL